MPARRRNAHRKNIEGPVVSGVNQKQSEKAVSTIEPETHGYQAPAAETPKGRGSLQVAVVLEIIAEEYSGGAQGEALCRVALRVAEESGMIESYRARWDEEESAPAGSRSSLLFDRSQCLELINYYRSRGNLQKQRQETEKLAQIEGRLLLGGSNPTRITDEDLGKLEEFIRESGF